MAADIGALNDKRSLFFGSNRCFYTGLTITSGTDWLALNPSGTLTGFGSASNEFSTKLKVVTSGANTTQLSFDAGSSLAFEYYGTEADVLDGIRVGSIWVRANGLSITRIQML